MTVTVNDVRTFLKDLPAEFVSDDVIQKQIDVATLIVNKEKSSQASSSDVDYAILVNAAVLSLMAYASEIERSLGVASPSLTALITQLQKLADKTLEYIKRGKSVPEPYFDVPYSLWDYASVIG